MAERGFLRMPVHVISIVLSQLDSMSSLAAATCSHSTLYTAYSEDRDRIIRRIIQNQIPPDILTHAYLPCLASSLDRSDLDRVGNFLYRDYDMAFALRNPPYHRLLLARAGLLDLHLANRLSRTHEIVEHFARDFVQDTWPLARGELGLRGPAEPDASVSETELFRIHRAMYRFQLYCNLFRHPCATWERANMRAVISIGFFNTFAPWVNEQLACIHDYFERVISRGFDEVAAHDIEWGYHRIDWLSAAGRNEYKQGYLFQGLEFLFQLRQAKTYGETRRVLQAAGIPPPRSRHMLGALFGRGSVRVNTEDWHRFWDEIDGKSHSGFYLADLRWCSSGPDCYGSGPFRMWRTAHEDCWRQDMLYHVDHDWLRRCGYVLWDASRHPSRVEQLRARILAARRVSLLNRFRRNDSRRQMRRSWKERASIYQRGGRGYWSDGDLSQVVWTGDSLDGSGAIDPEPARDGRTPSPDFLLEQVSETQS